MTTTEVPPSEEAIINLRKLSKELAVNYFNVSTYDMIQDLVDKGKVPEENKVFSELFSEVFVKDMHYQPDSFSRNILVIGSGCTFNAYNSDLPCANEAVSKIYRGIMLEGKNRKKYNLEYLLKCYGQKHNKAGFEKIGGSNTVEIDKRLDNLLQKNGENLLKHTASRYFDEYNKLKLYGGKHSSEEGIDFETSLNLLSKVLPVSNVREAVQRLYKFKHGPTLFYEIVAHLFKHRFIDVVISFNFDEFLDQAILDEIGSGGFDIILSDGDCKPIGELAHSGRLRQPLFIKPHGTASHKSTMRFTKDQYHDLPADMRKFLEEIISLENDDKASKINLITVGFEMSSFEFNDILSEKLPRGSQIFSFYYADPSDEKSVNKCRENRKKKLLDIFQKKENTPHIHLIGHEYFGECKLKTIHYPTLKGRSVSDELTNDNLSLDQTALILFDQIRSFFNKQYQPDNVSRHLLLKLLFGNRAFWKLARTQLEKYYPKNYFSSPEYFKDRVLLEVLIGLCLNRNKIDPPLFMEGRAGKYYSMYFNALMDKTRGKGTGLKPVVKLLELFSRRKHVNSLEVRHFRYLTYGKNFSEVFKKVVDLILKSNGYFSTPLRKYLADLKRTDGLKILETLFYDIGNSNRSRIFSEFRNTIHHVFEDYKTSDLINTDLGLDLHFHYNLMNSDIGEILIVADYGAILPKFIRDILRKDIAVKIILVDYRKFDASERIDKYDKCCDEFLWFLTGKDLALYQDPKLRQLVKILFLPVNEHNHHMTLFLRKKNEVVSSVYYYQKGVSQKINPIKITEPSNSRQLLAKFYKYSVSGVRHCFDWKSPQNTVNGRVIYQNDYITRIHNTWGLADSLKTVS